MTFAGGIHIDRTMGSKSTYIRAAIGGIEGRMLKKGDYFQIGVQPEMANRFVQDLQKDERIKRNGQLATAYYQSIRNILSFVS